MRSSEFMCLLKNQFQAEVELAGCVWGPMSANIKTLIANPFTRLPSADDFCEVKVEAPVTCSIALVLFSLQLPLLNCTKHWKGGPGIWTNSDVESRFVMHCDALSDFS